MGVDVAEKVESVSSKITEPKFVDISTLTYEQRTNPDYRLEQLRKLTLAEGYKFDGCTKCHHCR